MMTTWHSLTPIVLTLSAVCLGWILGQNQSDSSCNITAPVNCNFSDTFCGWADDGWYLSSDHATMTVSGQAAKLSATLQSGLACSTNNHTHCLKFSYMAFDDNNDTSALDVVVVQQNDYNRNESVWQLQVSDTDSAWHDVAVPVTTQSDFRVVFQATRDADQYPLISVRNVEYVHADCERRSPGTTTAPASATPTTQGGTGGAERCTFPRVTVMVVIVVVSVLMSTL